MLFWSSVLHTLLRMFFRLNGMSNFSSQTKGSSWATADRVAKMQFECGLNPFLKASDPACSIHTPNFFIKNFGLIHRSIRYNVSLKPYSDEWKRSELRLTAQISHYKQQTRLFHNCCARALCRNFAGIIIKTPDLAALHRDHGSIITDYDFLHFFRVLEDTAQEYGTILKFNNKQGIEIPRPKELPIFL